jgi:hypothetical protein
VTTINSANGEICKTTQRQLDSIGLRNKLRQYAEQKISEYRCKREKTRREYKDAVALGSIRTYSEESFIYRTVSYSFQKGF